MNTGNQNRTNAVRPKTICGMDSEEKSEERVEEQDGQRDEDDELRGGLSVPVGFLAPPGEVVEIPTDAEDDEDQDHGQRRVRKLHDPQLPSEKEVQEHYLSGHMPYRSWCHHCVRGRGREMDHLKRKGED